MIGLVFFVFSKPYRLARVVMFFDPQFKIIEKFDKKGTIKTRLQESLVTRDTNYQLRTIEDRGRRRRRRWAWA